MASTYRGKFTDVVLANIDADVEAELITSAQIQVFIANLDSTDRLATLATIYSSETGSGSPGNPFNATTGAVEFWALPGSYDIRISDTAGTPAFAPKIYRWDNYPTATIWTPDNDRWFKSRDDADRLKFLAAGATQFKTAAGAGFSFFDSAGAGLFTIGALGQGQFAGDLSTTGKFTAIGSSTAGPFGSGVYPGSSSADLLTIGNNFGATHESAFMNRFWTATESFAFRQQTAATANTKLMWIGPDGTVTAASKFVAGLVQMSANIGGSQPGLVIDGINLYKLTGGTPILRLDGGAFHVYGDYFVNQNARVVGNLRLDSGFILTPDGSRPAITLSNTGQNIRGGLVVALADNTGYGKAWMADLFLQSGIRNTADNGYTMTNSSDGTASFGFNVNVLNGNLRAKTMESRDDSIGIGELYGPTGRHFVRMYSQGGAGGTVVSSMSLLSETGVYIYGDSLGTVSSTPKPIHASALATDSDARLKIIREEISPSFALEKIVNLKLQKFNWIDESRGSQDEYGFIAQELVEHLPNVVSYHPSPEDRLANRDPALIAPEDLYAEVDYAKVGPWNSAAIKALYNELQAVKSRLVELEK